MFNMIDEMNSLDIKYIIEELKKLIGGRVQKIRQIEDKFIFSIYIGNEETLLIDPTKSIFITKYKREAPKEPSAFCMFLRKYLNGKIIKNIKQIEFDRIIELEFNDKIMIIEILKPGNIILTDIDYNIINTWKVQRFRDRKILAGIKYEYPHPLIQNIFKIDYTEFSEKLHNSNAKIIGFLATNGFGIDYAQEIIFRSCIENIKTNQLTKDQITKLFNTIKSIDKEKNPNVMFIRDSYIISPIKLSNIESTKIKEFEKFNNIIDILYYKTEQEMIEKRKKEKKQCIEKKLNRIESEQKKAIQIFEKKEKESQDKAKIIYNRFDLISDILNDIKELHENGNEWKNIEKKIKDKYNFVKLIPQKAKAVIEINKKKIELDIRKKPQQIASDYFKYSKKMRRKKDGAEKALEKTRDNIIEKSIKKIEKNKDITTRKKWYECYRWFISSDGYLVIGGRNAIQNESIINKKTNKKDLVFHADIHGAPFVVIKNEKNQDIPDNVIKEACEFAAAYSSAWKIGIGNVDVFWTNPENVKKKGGLPKGSFVINGKRYHKKDLELKLAIGFRLYDKKVIGGPIFSIRKNSNYYVTIQPGYKDMNSLAKEIKNKIMEKVLPDEKSIIEKFMDYEEIKKFIPSGNGLVI